MACAGARLVVEEDCMGLTASGSALVAKVRNSGKRARMPRIAGVRGGAVCAAAAGLVCVCCRAGKGKRRCPYGPVADAKALLT